MSNEIEFRPISPTDDAQVRDLLRRNSIPFDLDFALRMLDPAVAPGSRYYACYLEGRLVGTTGLFIHRLLFAGEEYDASATVFTVTDREMRRHKLGLRLLEDAFEHTETARSLAFNLSFINAGLAQAAPGRRSWDQAVSDAMLRFGYESKRVAVLQPMYRPFVKETPHPHSTEAGGLRASRVQNVNQSSGAIASLARELYSGYKIAELPDVRSVLQGVRFPNDYFWFRLERDAQSVGYVSCYRYPFWKGAVVQNQLHFHHFIVRSQDLAAAVIAIVELIKREGPRSDLFVINNSSIVDDGFLRQTGFYRGFTRLFSYLRCRPTNGSMKAAFASLEGETTLVLSVI